MRVVIAKVSIEKKADVILEIFAKAVACFFFQHGFLLEGFDVFFCEILAFW